MLNHSLNVHCFWIRKSLKDTNMVELNKIVWSREYLYLSVFTFHIRVLMWVRHISSIKTMCPAMGRIYPPSIKTILKTNGKNDVQISSQIKGCSPNWPMYVGHLFCHHFRPSVTFSIHPLKGTLLVLSQSVLRTNQRLSGHKWCIRVFGLTPALILYHII